MSNRTHNELALAEYQAIKGEQGGRIVFRDGTVRDFFATIAVVLAAVHLTRSGGYLLLVPFLACIFGWKYLTADNLITAIGRYFREHPELPGLDWEREHHADKRRTQRKVIQFIVDLTTFCGPAMVALVAFWMVPGFQPAVLLAASVIEAVAVGMLAWQFTVYADVPFTRFGAMFREFLSGRNGMWR